MKTALFLGAGASAFASLPTAKEIMERLRSHVKRHRDEIGLDEGIQNYIIRVVEDDTYDDIEELYNGIEQVINITTSHNCKPITTNMGDHKYGSIDTPMIDGLISLRSIIRGILRASFDINSGARNSIKQMYDMVREVVKDSGTEDVQVFTTNYDLVMETYAQVAGLELINGFEPYNHLSRSWDNIWDRSTDQPPLYLTKMHGSIYWHKDADGEIVETGSVADVGVASDIMIAPTMYAKDYNKKPFSTLIDRFRAAMRRVDVLLVIGFSYRDDEIVDIIKNELENGMALISVSPDADTSISRVSDTKIQTVKIKNERVMVVGSQIVLCDKEFGPDTIYEVSATLETAYAFIQRNIREARLSRAQRRKAYRVWSSFKHARYSLP